SAEASALATLVCLDSERVDDAERLTRLDEAEVIAERARSYRPLLRTSVLRSHILEGAGRHEEAIDVARRRVERARNHGRARVAGPGLAINLAGPRVSVGRWGEALTVIQQTLEQDPLPGQGASLRQLVGEVALARGELDTAAAELATVAELLDRRR